MLGFLAASYRDDHFQGRSNRAGMSIGFLLLSRKQCQKGPERNSAGITSRLGSLEGQYVW